MGWVNEFLGVGTADFVPGRTIFARPYHLPDDGHYWMTSRIASRFYAKHVRTEPLKIHTVVILMQHAEPSKAVRSKECVGHSGLEMTAPSMQETNMLIVAKEVDDGDDDDDNEEAEDDGETTMV